MIQIAQWQITRVTEGGNFINLCRLGNNDWLKMVLFDYITSVKCAGIFEVNLTEDKQRKSVQQRYTFQTVTTENNFTERMGFRWVQLLLFE